MGKEIRICMDDKGRCFIHPTKKSAVDNRKVFKTTKNTKTGTPPISKCMSFEELPTAIQEVFNDCEV